MPGRVHMWLCGLYMPKHRIRFSIHKFDHPWAVLFVRRSQLPMYLHEPLRRHFANYDIFDAIICILCLSSKNLNIYTSYLNSDTVGHRTWPSVCVTPRSQRYRCYGCGSWKCNLHPRICFVCRMKHTVPSATLRTVDGKSWAPVGREVSIPVIINGRRNC